MKHIVKRIVKHGEIIHFGILFQALFEFFQGDAPRDILTSNPDLAAQ
jgi:hypothetical protein